MRKGVVSGGPYGQNEFCFDYTMPSCAHHVTVAGLQDCSLVPTVDPVCKATCQSNTSIDYASDHHFAQSSYALNTVDDIKQDIYNHGTVTAAFTVYMDFLTY